MSTNKTRARTHTCTHTRHAHKHTRTHTRTHTTKATRTHIRATLLELSSRGSQDVSAAREQSPSQASPQYSSVARTVINPLTSREKGQLPILHNHPCRSFEEAEMLQSQLQVVFGTIVFKSPSLFVVRTVIFPDRRPRAEERIRDADRPARECRNRFSSRGRHAGCVHAFSIVILSTHKIPS